MDALKVRLRLGSVELEYEGPAGFLKEGIPALLCEVAKSASNSVFVPQATTAAPNGQVGGSAPASAAFDLTTNTVASILDAKTGPDLAIAAAAHLTLSKGLEKFSRKELLDQMQSATTFYNHNYSGNLSKILNGLTKGKRLNLVGNQTYALTKPERDKMTSALASAS